MNRARRGLTGGVLMTIPLLAYAAMAARNILVDFSQDRLHRPPNGFSEALTGKGKFGKWTVLQDYSSPERGNVLAQTDADPVDYRFPICLYDGLTAKDVDVMVRFKPVSGSIDQAAGIVWRCKDKNNYYVVRANALEGNVALYKIVNGKRSELPPYRGGRTLAAKATVPSGQWQTLRLTARGDRFEVYLEGNKLFEVKDAAFPDPGKVGLWTKADSVSYFDDLRITTF